MNLYEAIKNNLKEGTLWGEYPDEDEKYAKLMHDYVEELIKNLKDFGWDYDDSSSKYGHYRFSKNDNNIEYCDNVDKLGSAFINSDLLKGKNIPEDIDEVNGGGINDDDYVNIDFRWRHPSAYSLASFINGLVKDDFKESTFTDEERKTYSLDAEGFDDSGDEWIHCEWCNEPVPKYDCRKELNLGWICKDCQNTLYSRGEKTVYEESDEQVDTSKQKFIDYCKDKVKNLGTVTVNTKKLLGSNFDPDFNENKNIKSRFSIEMPDGSKYLSVNYTGDYLGDDSVKMKGNSFKLISDNVDGGELDRVAKLNFKYIDKDFYNDLLDNWESFEMPMRFEGDE